MLPQSEWNKETAALNSTCISLEFWMLTKESPYCQAPGPGLDQPGPEPGQPGHQMAKPNLGQPSQQPDQT